MLNWEFSEPVPSVTESEPVASQTFYITGEGDLEDEYAWVVASREDIGEVSEIYGALFAIAATATRPEDGRVTARIVASIIKEPGMIHIVSWRISN